MKRRVDRYTVFHPEFREDLQFWIRTRHATALRVMDLVEAIVCDPFDGPGKPEPLRFVLAGCWSRRIKAEHRLVCKVSDERIDFLRARYHY